MQYQRFDTELQVRPDDIDMNNHVHLTRYIDYVLAARYDQMERCYLLSMGEFTKNGLTWYAKSVNITFKRSLTVEDKAVVRTWLDSYAGADVVIAFQIFKKQGMKLAAEGRCTNTLVSITSGHPVAIPEWVARQYTKFVTAEAAAPEKNKEQQ